MAEANINSWAQHLLLDCFEVSCTLIALTYFQRIGCQEFYSLSLSGEPQIPVVKPLLVPASA